MVATYNFGSVYTDANESIEARGLQFALNFHLHITFLVYWLFTIILYDSLPASFYRKQATPSVRLSVRLYRPSVRNTFGVPSLCHL